MNSKQPIQSSTTLPKPPVKPKVVELKHKRPQLTLQEIEQNRAQEHQSTLGQRVADAMAAKVGSWGFLIGQTTVLTGWVTLNLMPGVPHWDQSPFILLNLMFSFASAYTAPIVLMSQNRQSDMEREKAEYDHQVNLKAGYDIELLHEKIDALQNQQMKELTLFIQQQRSLSQTKANVVPVAPEPQRSLSEIEVSVLSTLQQEHQKRNVVRKLPNTYSAYFPFGSNQLAVSDRQTNEQLTYE
jgi:uncharacterized membrane protein